jgi:crotonobetainyl-CoA:carnitine CoA-transferase CaiB-like acyl-CoA transferase
VLDLESEEGRAVFARLVARADVLVENYRPGALARLGLEPGPLLEANPRLIYCAISGFGQTGPYRDRLAMDLIVQAASGFLAHNGFPDGPPVKAGATVGDQVPAVYAAFGVLAALRQREQTGTGQLVDVAMFDVMASLVWDEPIEHYDQQGLGVRWGNFDPRGGPLNVYATTDGWLALAIGSNAHWQRLCVLMEREDLASAVTVADRTARLDELDAAVAAWCATQPTSELSTALDGAGIPNSAVVEPLDLRDDPHVAARGTLTQLVHPDSPDRPSGYLGAPMPLRLSGYPTSPPPAETLGASTDAVLADLAGLSAEELDGLRSRGVI